LIGKSTLIHRIFAALLGALLVLSLAVPARADGGIGYYNRLTFTNTTAWCVWLTIYSSDGGLKSLRAIKAGYVKPKGGSLTVTLQDEIRAQQLSNVGTTRIRVKTEILKFANCTGSTVGSTEITKEATAPDTNRPGNMAFDAQAQLDYGNSKFNLYWGADTYLPYG
jgi:hypothetical protein